MSSHSLLSKPRHVVPIVGRCALLNWTASQMMKVDWSESLWSWLSVMGFIALLCLRIFSAFLRVLILNLSWCSIIFVPQGMSLNSKVQSLEERIILCLPLLQWTLKGGGGQMADVVQTWLEDQQFPEKQRHCELGRNSQKVLIIRICKSSRENKLVKN